MLNSFSFLTPKIFFLGWQFLFLDFPRREQKGRANSSWQWGRVSSSPVLDRPARQPGFNWRNRFRNGEFEKKTTVYTTWIDGVRFKSEKSFLVPQTNMPKFQMSMRSSWWGAGGGAGEREETRKEERLWSNGRAGENTFTIYKIYNTVWQKFFQKFEWGFGV